MLKVLPNEHIEILTHIFNKCLNGDQIPDSWKEAAITLIYKDGDKAHPGNYRPITLPQVRYMLYTNILTTRLYEAFNKTTLSKLQHGFRLGHSSQDCIRALIDAIEDSHQHKKELHLAYIDLIKAYDSVSHEALLKVQAMHGVNEDRRGQNIWVSPLPASSN